MRRRSLLAALAPLAVVAGFACDKVTPVAPVGATITLSINPTRIAAQGEAATITAIVRKEDGTPVNPGTQVNFSTTLGVVDPEVAFTDETGVAKSTLTGDGRIGDAEVTATTGAASSVTVMVQVGSVAASITLTATPSDVPRDPQGDEGVVELSALVRDDTGAPLTGIVVNFAAEIGTLDSRGGPVVTDDLGQASDVLTVTRSNISVLTEPFFEVRAETAVEGGSLEEDVVEILISGVPADLTLQATPSVVNEAGGTLTLSALVVDGSGFPLEESRVSFLADIGTLGSGIVPTDADGRAVDTLTLTETDVSSLGALQTFQVRAQVAGLAGSVVGDEFAVRITSCRPLAEFTCTLVAGTLTYQLNYSRTALPEFRFKWTLRNAAGDEEPGSPEDFVSGPFTFSSTGTKSVTLEVTNGTTASGCGLSSTAGKTIANAGTTPNCT